MYQERFQLKEYLPVIQFGASFITRNNFDILDRKGNLLNPDSIPWSKFSKDYFPVTLRQREGTAVFTTFSSIRCNFNKRIRAQNELKKAETDIRKALAAEIELNRMKFCSIHDFSNRADPKKVTQGPTK
jgi:hypothetical protein